LILRWLFGSGTFTILFGLGILDRGGLHTGDSLEFILQSRELGFGLHRFLTRDLILSFTLDLSGILLGEGVRVVTFIQHLGISAILNIPI
jgi:hypothetical protein